jgi:hypothetical protein
VAGGREAAGNAAWEMLRDHALSDMDVLIQVITEAHDDLQAYGSALATYRRHLSAGGRAIDMSSLMDIPSIQSRLTDRLNQIERARSTGRVSFWRLLAAEGTTTAEIARMWGLSRQLVSRALTASVPRGSVQ